MRNTPKKTSDSAGNNAKKKKIITALVILVCAVPVMYLATKLLDRDWNEVIHSASVNEVVHNTNIKFADVNWDEDIFEDEVYLDKNRYITYKDGAVSQLITENHALYGVGPEFFSGYFTAVIHGDNETLNLMYTDEWSKNNAAHESFTPQKVYNIEIEKLSENVIEEGRYAGTKRYTFRVAYMIKDNNGTFRGDMGSDAAVPLIFELLDSGYGPKINSITKYTYAY
nr:hypothetical protein [Clostridia bacterium]